ncbi:MAG: FIST C-terminal domain-containing protein [Treponema sp.]|nr:FIST C-terminal domain-containing protein [Candidatus Treponema equifaecale]
MEQEVVSTRINDPIGAAEDLCRQLRKDPSSYKAVIFMAAIKYDFAQLSAAIKTKFPNSEVIGASTAGEIDLKGFQNDSVVLTTMADSNSRIKGVLVENGSKYPVGNKADIESALRDCGISVGDPSSHKSAFAITFINGVYNAEETILSNFYSIIKNDDFKLAGGTAGFTGNEAKTFVSYNGKTTQDGAAMLFVKTSSRFDIRQEDIFNPTGKTVYVTESDTVNRTIYKINGRPAKSVYAEQLGVSESQAEGMTFENPFGRHINGAIHIAALAGFTPERALTTFARVVPNSTLEMMHIGDPEEKCDETCAGIKNVIPNPKFVLMMTCITRTMAFERMRISDKIIRKYQNAFPTFCGFSCYGEQIGRVHCNQTLVTVTIGE